MRGEYMLKKQDKQILKGSPPLAWGILPVL